MRGNPCKQNDLAVVIWPEWLHDAEHVERELISQLVGLVVTCKAPIITRGGISGWLLSKPTTVQLFGLPFKVTGLADDVLQPVRPPGKGVVNQQDKELACH